MSVIYGDGNVVWKETSNLNMLILSAAATRATEIKTQEGGGVCLRRT